MTQFLTLLVQRRVWAGIVGVGAFIGSTFFGLTIDQTTLTETLLNAGTGLAALISGILALNSYFQPKK